MTTRYTDEGIYQRDCQREASVARGSYELLDALWKHHPRRMRLAFTYGMAERPTEPKGAPPKREHVPHDYGASAFFKAKPGLPLSGSQLIQTVSDIFDVSYGEIIGEGRARPFVEARAVIVQVLRQRGWSYPRIGKLLGNRDHTTIMHAHDTFGIHAKRNPLVAATFNRLRPDA
jgi:hypothetical protein